MLAAGQGVAGRATGQIRGLSGAELTLVGGGLGLRGSGQSSA